jgi:transposase-like protein
MRLTPEKRAAILAAAPATSMRAVARSVGVPPTTVRRVLAAERARGKLRTADEFRATAVSVPRRESEIFSWVLETIRSARDAQMRGDFKLAVKLANMMRTDDALFIAYHNRIAPQSAIGLELKPASGVRGEAVQRKALASVSVPRSVMVGLCGTLANHGIAIGYNDQDADEDGSIVNFRHTEWPLEHVKWNTSTEQLETTVKDGGVRVPIVHGDGRWTIYRKFAAVPWTQESCVLPGALIWAMHAAGVRDWAGASFTHGQSKLIGELPDGYSMQNASGMTPEARAFLDMLQAMVSGEAGAGLRPFGSKTDWVSSGSNAWQVFAELIQNREKAAARIYLGTDAILGSVGGAPGVDIAQLFGVASTKIQGDLEALEQGLSVGVYQPWCAVNYGDSRLAPAPKYQMPDPDEAQRAEHRATADTALMAAIKERKGLGFVVDQVEVDALALAFGVPAPRLAPAANQTSSVVLAPPDVAKVVRVREARAASGLLPFGDERDDLTISELDARAAAAAAATPGAPPPGQGAPA